MNLVSTKFTLITNTKPISSIQNDCIADFNNTFKIGSFYAIPSYYSKQGHIHTYRSNDKSNDKSNAILSIGTICDINRLFAGKQIAINFNGPTLIAIYIESIEDEILNKNVCNKIIQYFDDINNKYNISISILYPDYSDNYYSFLNFTETTPLHAKFPANALRNLVVSQTKTKYVSVFDIDFIYMSTEINQINIFHNSFLLNDAKKAWIIPAFEWISYESEQKFKKHLLSKIQLLKLLKLNHIQPFHYSKWKKPQICTNYSKWYNASNNYIINYCNTDYEPWLIIKTDYAKKYKWNNQYIGRRKNKVQQINNLVHNCFTLEVMHNMFSIHGSESALHNVKNKATWQEILNEHRYKQQLKNNCNDTNSCITLCK